jgi:hypothetical protein
MNFLCKKTFLHKKHDLIAFEIFCLNKLFFFLHMTKETTPSIGGNQIKSKLGIFMHTTLGARSVRSAHRGP